jgi:hypothetical protein
LRGIALDLKFDLKLTRDRLKKLRLVLNNLVDVDHRPYLGSVLYTPPDILVEDQKSIMLANYLTSKLITITVISGKALTI